MAFDVPVARIISLVGHDGSEIAWPELKEPYNRRGFHLQEMTEVGLTLGFAVLIIESEMLLVSSDPDKPKMLKSLKPVIDYLDFSGVILGVWPNGSYHAIYYSNGICYDPDGHTYPYNHDVRIEIFCPVLKSNHFPIAK
jgi:hypothetical protein